MSLRRYCLALDLVDDAALIADYERWHAPGGVWPEVVADLRAQGIAHMEIWRVGTRMLMIVETSAVFPTQRTLPARIAEWETMMARFQAALPGAAPGEKWMSMTRIFNLDQQEKPAAETD
jgi:L-rhamnose mutarotase